MDKKEILAIIKKQKNALDEFGVRSIALFGSFAREDAKENSDIDILVEFVLGRKTFDTFMGLSLFLEEILQNSIELVTVESLNPYIGPHIPKEV